MGSLLVHIIVFSLGVFLWSIIEYLIHGILSHRIKTPVSTMHWEHHRNPRRVFTSPLAPLIISPILWWAFSFLLGKYFSFILILGVILGFAYYEYAHWRIHFREPKNSYQKRIKAHHLAHHFCNARMYHGVTSAFWDRVFSTNNEEEQRKAHYEKSLLTPPMDGVSNLREIYSLKGLKTITNSFSKKP